MKTVKTVSSFFAIALSLVAIIVWQAFFVEKISFYLMALCILILSMIPFVCSFELKKTTSKEVTLVATLIALAVVSRVAFYLIPQVKPIAAVVIVSAVCLGAERGYIIGAFSAFVSNFVFGQGYWTVFQMVALGMVGLLAGLIFKVAKPNKITMAIVGFILVFVVYGVIVDASTVFIMGGSNVTWQSALAVYASGAPFSAVYAGATAVFLFIFGEPFIKKIERINIKYGLCQQTK